MTVIATDIRPAPGAPLEVALLHLAESIEQGRVLDASQLAQTRLAEARTRFGLTEPEMACLGILAGVAVSSGFAEAVAKRTGQSAVTAGTLAALLPELGLSSFAPAAVLRAWRLVHLQAASSLRLCPVAIDERLLAWLMHVPGADARLAHAIRPVDTGSPLIDRYKAEVPGISRMIVASAGEGRPISVALVGAGRATRLALAGAVAEALGMVPLGIDPMALQAAPEQAAVVRRLIAREMVLERALPVIEVADDAQAAAVPALEGPALLLAAAGTLRPGAECPTRIVTLDPPDASERAELWMDGLGLEAADAAALAEGFTLEADDIAAIVRDLPEGDPANVLDLAWAATRRKLAPPPDPLIAAIEPRADWSDLVLPPAVEATLRAIAAQARNRATVYRDWGFAGPVTRGLGISALFTGPSGTGKTLAAEVLANDLGRLLLRVDLAQVVDKYVGETEKHLDRIFAHGERSGAILLFDEADALFRQRGDGDTANERFGAMTVAYLLQRLEATSATCILTSNLRSVIDEAFLRRIRFVVQFAFPGLAERRRLWLSAIPEAAPRGALDVEALARLPATGGTIRTVALNAAFLAADANSPIEMMHLLRAFELENAKLEPGLDLAPLRKRIVG